MPPLGGEFVVLPIALAATMDNNYVVKHKTLTKL
jgi:hypothetical protein